MSELTNVFARNMRDLTTPTSIGVDPNTFDNAKIPIGNAPQGFESVEALTVKQIKDLAAKGLKEELEYVTLKISNEEIRAKQVEAALIKDKANKATTILGYGITDAYTQGQIDSKVNNLESKKANKVDVDTALSNLSITANKYYSTKAEAEADIANIALNQSVTIGEEANSGLWEKKTVGATTLTKSPYDPLTQAKADATTKADAAKSEAITASVKHSDLKLNEIRENSGSASNLFQFEDSQGKTVVAITNEADIRNPNYSLNEIGEATGKSAAKISDQLDKTASTALYEFNDADGNIVIEFSEDGDVKTPNGGLYETIEQQQTIKDKINGQLEANQNKTAFEFDDSQGNTIIEFEDDGDIVFNGGRSLIAELEKVNSSSSFKRLSLKESITDDFISALSQASFNNSGQKSPVFNGVAKQKYAIANTQDFLNIKISEPEPLLIDTPYFKGLSTVKPYSQVVHPYICEFNQTVRGYKYIVLLTPFHNTNDFYENPCVYGSNDLQKMELLTGFDQPLAKAFMNMQYDYNSDNFAVYDHLTGEFCVVYRHAIKQNDVDQAFLKVRKTVDFINWTEFEIFKDELGNDLVCGLSPSIVYNPTLDKWMMHSINYFDGKWNLVYQTSNDLINGWSASAGTTKSDDFKFWHQETRYCGGHFITIINDVESDTVAIDGKGGLHLGVSLDGINFEYSEQILETPYHNPYKASLSPVLENGELSFNIMWTDNGNVQDGWRLYSVKTNSIEVN